MAVVQISRIQHRSGVSENLPQLARGNIGWAVQTELGLYPNQEAKEKQELFNELTQGQIDAIKSLEEFGR